MQWQLISSKLHSHALLADREVLQQRLAAATQVANSAKQSVPAKGLVSEAHRLYLYSCSKACIMEHKHSKLTDEQHQAPFASTDSVRHAKLSASASMTRGCHLRGPLHPVALAPGAESSTIARSSADAVLPFEPWPSPWKLSSSEAMQGVYPMMPGI